MLQLISATGQQTVDALAFLLAFALTALMDSVFHDKLPHDHGRAFAVNGELSKGKARGSGLIFVLCIALVTLAVVPFKVEYLIYTVLLIASMLSGYFDDASETAWNEYKKGLIDFVIAVVTGVTYLNFNGTSVNFLSTTFTIAYPLFLLLILELLLILGSLHNLGSSRFDLCKFVNYRFHSIAFPPYLFKRQQRRGKLPASLLLVFYTFFSKVDILKS